MQLSKPNNEWALVVRFLIEYYQTGVTMKECCLEYFHKFQSRLGELERSLNSEGEPRSINLKIRRLRMPHTTRFETKTTYINYKPLCSLTYLERLYNKLNLNGLKSQK